MNKHWAIWIDTGGTFTDCIATDPEGKFTKVKVLSSGILRVRAEHCDSKKVTVTLPFHVDENTLTGFFISSNDEETTIVSYHAGRSEITLEKPFRQGGITHVDIYTREEVPVFAARLITQTPLGKSFPPIEMKLGSTRGTNALLERKGARTALLITKGFRDLLLIGNQQRQNLFSLFVSKEIPLYDEVIPVAERMLSDGSVMIALDKREVKAIIRRLRQKKIQTVAVAFLNSYRNPLHENAIGSALAKAGFRYISLSHKLSSQPKILNRTETAVVNAYLEPVIDEYISRIRSVLTTSSISVMSSAGGLLNAADFKPKDSLLSGPAGGVIGAINKAKRSGFNKIITFDMGGTSTDVSRCDTRPDYRFECKVGTLKIFSPSLAIETIAAGGGSICYFDGFSFQVGPRSAGASPGPACYGAGGPLTITDVNLLLGRLDPANFPIPVDKQNAASTFDILYKQLLKNSDSKSTKDEVLESFINIANEKMADAIRKISVQQGHDLKEYALLCFGGAGGQHACALASLLQMEHIIIPYDAGLLSAFGIGHAKMEKVKESLILKPYVEIGPDLDTRFEQLFKEAKDEIFLSTPTIHIKLSEKLIFMRLKGQETSIEIAYSSFQQVRDNFIKRYKEIYGHYLEHREIEVEFIRVIVVSDDTVTETPLVKTVARYSPAPLKTNRTYSSGSWSPCPVFQWENIVPGAYVEGPAIILSNNSTTFVDHGWSFDLDENQNANLRQIRKATVMIAGSEAANLALYTNRFTTLVEEMGTLLQRTSFSVNVKERLDFSCALMDALGNLVVNAPHIPVHLGSLGVCVRSVIKTIDLKEGDVIITNHPAYGGSHLPDITLIKPIYIDGHLLAFVANRAHHAEIGGRKPGSMPADATTLEEEGVIVAPTYLMKGGVSQWSKIEALFTTARYPTRSFEENAADLNAAMAALQLGEKGFKDMCAKYGLGEVTRYMNSLRDHASKLMSVRIASLKSQYRATEKLDDGRMLKVSVRKTSDQTISIDFSGSSGMHPGNLNATTAIVQSVVLYVMRLIASETVPLNEGLLDPVTLNIPPGILNPRFSDRDNESPAVVGGNTEISQRLTDTLLKAFRMAACSQGTMNNLLFGNNTFGYYETICGGVGAGPGFRGADAVHQHMTNTRITDPEIIELRYPVILEEFAIRRNSGGKGKWKGGNGVIRTFLFKEDLEVNILSQHRVVPPYGMLGGNAGKVGAQYLVRDKRKRKLPGVVGLQVKEGDRIIILTPGGGGWKSP